MLAILVTPHRQLAGDPLQRNARLRLAQPCSAMADSARSPIMPAAAVGAVRADEIRALAQRLAGSSIASSYLPQGKLDIGAGLIDRPIGSRGFEPQRTANRDVAFVAVTSRIAQRHP